MRTRGPSPEAAAVSAISLPMPPLLCYSQKCVVEMNFSLARSANLELVRN